jgi:hypothetical protein
LICAAPKQNVNRHKQKECGTHEKRSCSDGGIFLELNALVAVPNTFTNYQCTAQKNLEVVAGIVRTQAKQS